MRRSGWGRAAVVALVVVYAATACKSTPAGYRADAAVAMPDAEVGVPVEVPTDAAVDAPIDADGDAPVDAPIDASADASVDASPDAAVDATVDARPDATVDAMPDATPDAAPPCTRPDTDGDGWTDDVERAVGAAPDDPSDTPPSRGLVVLEVPFDAAPRPPRHDLDTRARLARADVVLLVDTTGSMTGTLSRIGPQFQALVTMLAGEIDDLAFGAAGYGDFPMRDNANSEYDVPFYRVHRVMTARSAAGLASLIATMIFRNIIIDGLGPWFALMRGGDEPEQGWEALRQLATGVGITYPLVGSGTGTVPPFAPASAHPRTIPAGEETGVLGGVGFRPDSVPIVLMVTDTEHHDAPVARTTPTIATPAEAIAALAALHARVVGLMAWKVTGHDDLRAIAEATHARVSPDAWGTGADRPANCPAGRCCLVAEDPDTSWPETQPLPVGGQCTLVFQSDRYDTNLGRMMTQAIVAIARGAPFSISAEARDGAGDSVDAVAAFVERVEALPSADCAGGGAPRDRDGDGVLDTFEGAIAGARVCFRLTVRTNRTVPAAADTRAFPARLQLTGDGLAAFVGQELRFVVPGTCR